MTRYEITLGGDAVWFDDGNQPVTFATEAEAEAALAEYFKDCAQAVADGHMTDDGSDDDWRIVPVTVSDRIYIVQRKLVDSEEYLSGDKFDNRADAMTFLARQKEKFSHREWRVVCVETVETVIAQ